MSASPVFENSGYWAEMCPWCKQVHAEFGKDFADAQQIVREQIASHKAAFADFTCFTSPVSGRTNNSLPSSCPELSDGGILAAESNAARTLGELYEDAPVCDE